MDDQFLQSFPTWSEACRGETVEHGEAVELGEKRRDETLVRGQAVEPVDTLDDVSAHSWIFVWVFGRVERRGEALE